MTPTVDIRKIREAIFFAMSGEYSRECICDGCKDLHTHLGWLASALPEMIAHRGRLAWIDAQVQQGRGDISFGITENGNVGVFIGNEPLSRGTGDTVEEAIDAATSSTALSPAKAQSTTGDPT